MIKEIHNAVRGRVRFKISGLYRSAALRDRLELIPSQSHEVIQVSASILTGNALVIFNSECNPRIIAMLIEKVVTEFARTGAESSFCEPSEAGSPRSRTDDAAERRAAALPPTAVRDRDQPFLDWHLMDKESVLAALDSCTDNGLSAESAKRSCEKYGLNIVPEPESRSKLGIFVDQFNSLPVALLGVAAGLSIATGGLADAVVIAAVVGINAVIGYLTESEAEKTIRSLKSLIRPSAQVLRDRAIQEIPAEQVLIGDILVLRPGTFVTADARIVQALHLSVDESVLTGESMPVSKISDALNESGIPLADRVNMVYSGTLIMGGQGLAVVVATGRMSEMGRIQTLLASAEAPETPIERQLTTIGNQLVIVSGFVCALVFVIGLLRGNGLIQMLHTAISLAVAAVPEGLPTVATTTLALGINEMRRQKVLIRNLDAICTLGSIQTICFDKTGTVTRNRMEVIMVYAGGRRLEASGGNMVGQGMFSDSGPTEEFQRLLSTCVLCNETQVEFSEGRYILNGSSTENALIQMAINCGVDVASLRGEHPLLATSYRSDDRQYMSTTHSLGNGERLIALKGSPVEVLTKCNYLMVQGESLPLDDRGRDAIEAENDRMAGNALRVLGVAYALESKDGQSDGEAGLTWLGLVGMADPIRDGVKQSIHAFHQAGLETVMITGDQSPTAYAVGRAIGLSNGQPLEILDSTSLSEMDPAVVKALGTRVHVFSRVSPSHKLQIVQALQSSGQVVAMTGDGINDGPALKAADIGIAMGLGGTDVAREVADVVLQDDDLETLILAVSGGRTIYTNIRKTLHYLLATNFSEIQVMFVATALGIGYPLNAMQLLWINLVSDTFPGLALALEPAEPGVMSKPPRDPMEPIVKTEDFKRITFEAAAMTTASLAAYGFGVMRYGMGATAGTMAFHSLTTSQILHAMTCRSEERSILDAEPSAPNKYLNMAIIFSLGLQLATLFVPGLRNLLGITPLTALDGLVVAGASVMPLLITEATKSTSTEGPK